MNEKVNNMTRIPWPIILCLSPCCFDLFQCFIYAQITAIHPSRHKWRNPYSSGSKHSAGGRASSHEGSRHSAKGDQFNMFPSISPFL